MNQHFQATQGILQSYVGTGESMGEAQLPVCLKKKPYSCGRKFKGLTSLEDIDTITWVEFMDVFNNTYYPEQVHEQKARHQFQRSGMQLMQETCKEQSHSVYDHYL